MSERLQEQGPRSRIEANEISHHFELLERSGAVDLVHEFSRSMATKYLDTRVHTVVAIHSDRNELRAYFRGDEELASALYLHREEMTEVEKERYKEPVTIELYYNLPKRKNRETRSPQDYDVLRLQAFSDDTIAITQEMYRGGEITKAPRKTELKKDEWEIDVSFYESQEDDYAFPLRHVRTDTDSINSMPITTAVERLTLLR